MLLRIRRFGLLLLRERRLQAYAFTFFTEFVALGAIFIALKLAASLLGPEGFGQYTVARRAYALLAPTLTVALSLSLTRSTARLGSTHTAGSSAGAYFVAGLLIALPPLGLFAVLAGIFSPWTATVFFGSSAHADLIPPLILTVTGLGAHYVLYGYLRGRSLTAANVLQLLDTVFVPPLALLLAGPEPARVIAFTGLGWLAVTAAAGVWIWRDCRVADLAPSTVWRAARELVTYGAPRLPAELALPGLFSVPTFLVAQFAGVQTAGYFSFGLSLLQLIGSVVAPTSLLLLPWIARLQARGAWDQIARIVTRLLLVGIGLVVPLVLLAEALLEPLVIILLGPEFRPAVGEVRWLLLGAIPYAAYILLRSPLDAINVWPHNSVHLVAALLLATGLIGYGRDHVSPPVALLLAFTLLGLLSYLTWRRLSVAIWGPQGTTSMPADLPGRSPPG